jgi:hypothetical protein
VIAYGTCVTGNGGYGIVGGRLVGQSRYVELARFTPEHPVMAPEPSPDYGFPLPVLDNFPNPFNSSTFVTFRTSHLQEVTLNVTDLLGRHVATLHDGMLEPGEHKFTFDGSNLPSGIYFARVQAGGFVKTQKLLLLK